MNTTQSTISAKETLEAMAKIPSQASLQTWDAHANAVLAVCEENDRLQEMLMLALPYVEEGEVFNKPNGPKLSERVRLQLEIV